MKRIRTKKLWRLLEMAIDDAQRMRRRKDVTLSMGDWLRFTNEGCFACLAGCVMLANGATPALANEFGDVLPSRLDDERKYRSINSMRSGEFEWAYCQAYGFEVRTETRERVLSDASDCVNETYNSESGLADWRSYRKAIRILKAANL